MTFTVFVLWIHLAAITVWVGGLFALALVMVPVLRQGAESPVQGAAVFSAGLKRFQRISREVLLLILLTGIFNLANTSMAGIPFDSRYMSLLGTKLMLFAVMIWIQVWQSQKLTAEVEAAADGRADTLPGLYRKFWITSAINMGFAVIMIALGLSLGRG